MIIDIHAHFPFGEYKHPADLDLFLRRARRFKVERICLSGHVNRYGFNPTARQVREINSWTLEAMARHPEQIVGLCFINPAAGAGAVRRELDWAIARQGFRGIKLWVSVNCRSRKLDPVLARAQELDVPVLQHASYNTLGKGAPHESTPADVADLACRFPAVRLIMAHLGHARVQGLTEIAPHRNILVDISGSQPARGLLEEAVRRLGAQRIVFGTDLPIRDYASILGRLYEAPMTDQQRRLILGQNAARLLRLETR
ncbi:MAG: amidohydrolase family protein [Planctomycetota bacterium]